MRGEKTLTKLFEAMRSRSICWQDGQLAKVRRPRRL